MFPLVWKYSDIWNIHLKALLELIYQMWKHTKASKYWNSIRFPDMKYQLWLIQECMCYQPGRVLCVSVQCQDPLVYILRRKLYYIYKFLAKWGRSMKFSVMIAYQQCFKFFFRPKPSDPFNTYFLANSRWPTTKNLKIKNLMHLIAWAEGKY